MPEDTQTNNVQGAQWTTAYVDSLPDSSFAYVDGKTRKLPYKDKDGKVDLPHVRNALARLNQAQGISDEEKAKIRTKLQSALKNAKAADDMVLRTTNVVASDGATLPERVHLLRDGEFNTQKYGKIPIAASDLYEMKFNFDRGVGMAHEGETGIPIDFAHQSHLKAAGWVRGLEVVQADGGTELWGTNVEWSDSGRQALLGKEYKCLSSDFYPAAFGEWVDPESGISAKNVIVGAALTNRPMFTGNQPVIASDSDGEAEGVKTVIYVQATSNKENSMKLDELRVKEPESLQGAEYKFIVEHQSELSADERVKFGLQAAAEPQATAVKASEVKGNEGKVVVEAAELKAANDKLASLEASVKELRDGYTQRDREAIRKDVLAHATRGAIKMDRVDSWTDRIVASDEKGRNELWADLKGIPSNKALADVQGSADGEDEIGSDPRAELMNKAIKLAQDEKIDIREATEKVKASDPALAERAAAQGRERTSSIEASDDQFKAAGVNRG